MTNPRTLTVRSLTLGVGVVLLAGGCGNDSTESVIEEIVEQQGGGDVDLDLDGDGGFSIDTEEGGITIDDDGNFVVTGPDGEVITGEAGTDGDGGFSVDAEGGGVSIDDDGNFVVTGPDGEVLTGEAGADGDFNVEGEDGGLSISSGSELPSEWPAEVAKPDGLAIESSTVIGSDGEQAISLYGSAGTDPAAFLDSYSATLISSGFELTGSLGTGGNATRLLTNGTWGISIGAGGIGGSEQTVSVTLFKES